MKRRAFLETVAAGASITSVLHAGDAQSKGDNPSSQTEDAKRGEMRYRKLGQTGEQVSLLGLGGHHIGRQKDEQESFRIIRAAIDGGINFMDNCWDYHDGGSETRMGKALQDGYRTRVILMTKLDGRSRKSAEDQLHDSLKRLQTDMIDLVQFHEIIRMEDADRIFAEGGAIEALLAAKKAGKLRFIGFTGHKDPAVHLRMLEVAEERGFRFDAVQMPLNVMDAHFRSFGTQVLPVLVRRHIGVLGMKSMADGNILKSKAVTAMECLHYAMSLPTSTVITGIDSMQILEQAFEAVRTFQPFSESQTKSLLDRTASSAKTGRFEPFKTTNGFDGTAQHPDWLGPPDVGP